MGDNIAVSSLPPMPGKCKKQGQNTDYSGETWLAGEAEPISLRVAVSLGDPMLGGVINVT